MSTIVTRQGKGTPLLFSEVDQNFINLNNDKTENANAAITGGSINGASIGGTTASSGKFTTLIATGDLTVDTNTLYVDSTNNRVGIGTTSPSVQFEVTGTAKLSDTTDSSSSSTGTLLVSGGVGIAKKLYVGTDAHIVGTLNADGGSLATNQTTFNLVNSTATTLNIGGAATTISIGANTGTLTFRNAGIIHNSTSYLKLPVGTSGQRPGSPSEGMVRYNSEISSFEGYASGAWSSLGGVKSVDGLTYIVAETSAGASNDELEFYAATSSIATSKVGGWNQTRLLVNTALSMAGTASIGTLNLTNALGILYGGTGATTTTGVGGALDNLLPSGEVSGYVLTTSGAGSYFWAAAGGGSGNVGTKIDTQRQTFTATSSQTLFALSSATYTPGAGQLRVYLDGVRQFPEAYTETSSSSFTLSTGVAAGTKVLAEIDGFVSYPIAASDISNSAAGDISATTVQAAINELDSEKAPKASPTFTGTINAADLILSGNLTVNGTTTTINSTTVSVDDKNIELGSVTSPTNTTADGGGITLKGATDKTLNWVNATAAWTSSEDFNLLTGKVYEINGTTVLSATALGSGVTSSSLTSVGTISTGTWQGSIINSQYGGTGVNNSGRTITIGGNFATSGAFAVTLTVTNTTNVTLPTTGTLATLAGSETLTNKTISGGSLSGTTVGGGTIGTNAVGTRTVQTVASGVPSNATGNNGDIIYQY